MRPAHGRVRRPLRRPDTRRPSEDGRVRAAIAARLAAARRTAGMTQIGVADRLRRPRSWIGKLETGRRGLLFSEAVELAELYGIEVNDLMPSPAKELQRASVRSVVAE
jgi:transcriptional regulator with XRE-family HTH domain